MIRQCTIIDASVGHDGSAADDGAYDLLDVEGDPATVGIAIAESLEECDLFRGRGPTYLEAGHDIFINLTIRIRPTGGTDAIAADTLERDEPGNARL